MSRKCIEPATCVSAAKEPLPCYSRIIDRTMQVLPMTEAATVTHDAYEYCQICGH